jgi:NTE family protein
MRGVSLLAGRRSDHRHDAVCGWRLDSHVIKKTINLALQGGGAHGAFTWGALDRLLEEDSIEIEGISATSAGAMNAAALKHGFLAGGNEGARDRLEKFWLKVAGLDGPYADAVIDWLQAVSPSPAMISRTLDASPGVLAAEMLTRTLSPYQFNPMNYNPLRAVVDEMLDYDRVCSTEGPKLFITATNVRTGRAKVFQGTEISTDAILASACLPTISQAIKIDDAATGRREAYWDGGYTGNPALFPLFYETETPDILIVHINPLHRDQVPSSPQGILDRINEISFNASLMRELRNINFVNRLIGEGVIAEGAMKRNLVHSISDDALMNQLGIATKMMPNKTLILQLRDAGRAAMDVFLGAHSGDIGKRSSLDLHAMFSDGS